MRKPNGVISSFVGLLNLEGVKKKIYVILSRLVETSECCF